MAHFANLYKGTTTDMLVELANHHLTIDELQAALTNATLKIQALQRIVEEHSIQLRAEALRTWENNREEPA